MRENPADIVRKEGHRQRIHDGDAERTNAGEKGVELLVLAGADGDAGITAVASATQYRPRAPSLPLPHVLDLRLHDGDVLLQGVGALDEAVVPLDLPRQVPIMTSMTARLRELDTSTPARVSTPSRAP